ncbi:MAG: RimK family alpha-L-glutamate ligase [Pseudomonadota bacterium]|nr:RimK family alpha-L-glutamate ligase [Pseudomonadota bacterium]
MNPEALFYPPAAGEHALLGLPHIMELAFRGVDLNPLRQQLLERAQRQPGNANALMDLSTVMGVCFHEDLARQLQGEALAVSRTYTLAASASPRLRVLALMTPGSLMANIPIEFLLQGSDISLDMLYLTMPLTPGVLDFPPHDVVCMAVCEAPAAQPLLQTLAARRSEIHQPMLNDPLRVLDLAREILWRLLHDSPGCLVPSSERVNRAALLLLADGADLGAVLPGGTWPIICRPLGSHAGHGLVRLAKREDLRTHLDGTQGEDFVISSFIAYASPDGQYRKMRIAVIGGKPYPVHMVLSTRWLVHYLNGDMLDQPDNRAAERAFFERFDTDFMQRHAAALAVIDERLGLDYYSIDCAESQDGRLLVFECDIGGVVHAMDPPDDFDYKRKPMLRLFEAFRELLLRAARDPGCLKPRSPGCADSP